MQGTGGGAMQFFVILFSLVFLFAIFYFAASLAVRPLYKRLEELTLREQQDSGLVKLRDFGVIDNDELEEIIEIYRNQESGRIKEEEYQKYLNVLNELKETGYFTEEVYALKAADLRQHYKRN
jgi:hypothetical protein